MRATTLLRILLGLHRTLVIAFEFTWEGLVVDVAPSVRAPYCAGCGRSHDATYDHRKRTWRHLEIIGLRVWLRYALRRVDCPRCGPTSELVPWAEHGSTFTRMFEEAASYLAQRTDKTTVAAMMGIAWPTVGNIVHRVVKRLGPTDLLDGLTHIGVDELSYRRHHEYITIVTNHISGRVIWAARGKNAETFKQFFDELGAARTAGLKVVTMDMSKAYIKAVQEIAPNAEIVFDRFHVQRLAHDALDEVRRAQMREQAGTPEAKALKNTRFALQKNTWNLTQPEKERLAVVEQRNRPLYRAYLLKETLAGLLDGRQVNVARDRLAEWTGWASKSRLEPFMKLAKTLKSHAEGILAYVATGLSNARIEGLNGKVRTITRRAYGFHSPGNLIALIFLCCSGIVLEPLRRFPRPIAATG